LTSIDGSACACESSCLSEQSTVIAEGGVRINQDAVKGWLTVIGKYFGKYLEKYEDRSAGYGE
jgi:hypothetical protein